MSLKHGNSLLLYQGIKNGWTTAKNQRARAMGNPRQLLGFSWLPDRLHFYLMVKALLGYSVNALTMNSPKKEKIMFH